MGRRIKKRTKEEWMRLPLRRCYTQHKCAICEELIYNGQDYHDGGYLNRAHESCVILTDWKPDLSSSSEGSK